MMTIIHKASSCGSSVHSIFPNKLKLQIGHFLFYLRNPLIERHHLLISQISLVQQEVLLPMKKQKPINIFIPGKRLSDIIDLNSFILFFGIRKEKDLTTCKPFGCQINKITFWTFPNAMELSLNKNFRPLPDGPTDVLFSAVSNDMLWNDSKTFIRWFANQGPQWNKGRLLFRNLAAK